MRSLRLNAVVALGATLASSLSAALVEKTWFFTTTDTLTVDVRLASHVDPDWAASALVLSRIDGREPPQRLALDSKLVRPWPENGVTRVSLAGLKVTRWEPISPVLYRVALDLADRAGHRETTEERVGFRSFTTQGGQLHLNGRPFFLRGLAINPPNRGVPEKLERSREFAVDYVRYLLGLHVNIIRIPDDETWFDVCDELGMLVFGGNYGGSINGKGSTADPAASAEWFRETKFHPFVQHPSLIVYALTNEVAGEGTAGARWDKLLGAIHHDLQPWDPTRLYIANAGYGYGRVGEINDLHRYWGWYYQSPFTFLHLRDNERIVAPDKVQPLTFTECVGNYNGPDGRTNLTPNHKNPVSQLNWLGHAPTAEQGPLGFAHQSFTIRQATELFRRLRPLNNELSGVFPFTILFNRWHDITSFAEMSPKPAADQLRASYQPVLLSWELYTPQVYAGAELHPVAHLVNDSDTAADLRGATLDFEVRDSTQRTVAAGKLTGLDVAYYATARRPLTLKLPASLATGSYHLWGRLTSGERTLSENQIDLFVAASDFARAGAAPRTAVRLIDPVGTTQRAFTQLGLAAASLSFTSPLDPAAPIVIGEEAVAKLDATQSAALVDFTRRGGRLVILRQPSTAADALAKLLPAAVRLPSSSVDDPAYPPPPRPSRDSINVNPERPDHPLFAGIDRRRLQVWSDYTGWDETKKGLPRIYPVSDGFVLTDKSALRHTAVLANYSVGLEGLALAEFFPPNGDGSVLLSGFDLVARAGLDPIADRLLRNLVAYATQREGHERHVLIEAPIVWGDYETERGVLTGINSGLMLNSRPALTGSYRDSIKVTVTPEGHQFAGGPGGWNSRPGIVYVPFGRRPFGPYSHRSWSGTPAPDVENKTGANLRAKNPDAIYDEPEALTNLGVSEGEGRFWCRIPSGKAQANHRLFNPSDAKLTVRISANGREVAAELAPGATAVVTVPLAAETTTVETRIRGDRRLVLLETSFQ
ncbi:MAG: hypothetical protein HZA93_19635 [Verrucomicrobia bacterium]|nr:hypothetical protein [Verrucomicrobiota bacterium]